MGRAVFTGRLKLFGTTVPLVPPLMLAQSRTTLAAIVLFPVLLFARGPASLRMKAREILDCVIFGTLGIAASNYFYYLAIQRTSVATARNWQALSLFSGGWNSPPAPESDGRGLLLRLQAGACFPPAVQDE